jgi:hypothetical protein
MADAPNDTSAMGRDETDDPVWVVMAAKFRARCASGAAARTGSKVRIVALHRPLDEAGNRNEHDRADG